MDAAYMTYLLLLCCMPCITGNSIIPCLLIIIIDLYTCLINYVIGTDIVLTHSTGIKADVALVCNGRELELICTLTLGRVLEWSISLYCQKIFLNMLLTQ